MYLEINFSPSKIPDMMSFDVMELVFLGLGFFQLRYHLTGIISGNFDKFDDFIV
jgi:hypothetical protein